MRLLSSPTSDRSPSATWLQPKHSSAGRSPRPPPRPSGSRRGQRQPPRRAALLSQESALKEQLAQLQVNGAVATDAVQLVTPATAPSAPSSPKPLRDAILGFVLGLLLGIGLASMVEHLDDTIYLKEEVERFSPRLAGLGPRPDGGVVEQQGPGVRGHSDEAELRSGGGLSLAADLAAVRRPRRSRPGDPGHQCERGRGKKCDGGQPGRGARQSRGAGSYRLVRPAPTPPGSVLRAGRTGRPDHRAARPLLTRGGTPAGTGHRRAHDSADRGAAVGPDWRAG
jgi:hypothetical protein